MGLPATAALRLVPLARPLSEGPSLLHWSVLAEPLLLALCPSYSNLAAYPQPPPHCLCPDLGALSAYQETDLASSVASSTRCGQCWQLSPSVPLNPIATHPMCSFLESAPRKCTGSDQMNASVSSHWYVFEFTSAVMVSRTCLSR